MNPPHFFRALSGWLMQVSTKNPMEVFHCIGKMTTLQVQIDIDLNIPVCYWFFFKQSVFSLDFKKNTYGNELSGYGKAPLCGFHR